MVVYHKSGMQAGYVYGRVTHTLWAEAVACAAADLLLPSLSKKARNMLVSSDMTLENST